MLIMVAGDSGLAGSAISQYFQSQNYEVIGLNSKIVNLLDTDATFEIVKKYKPHSIIDAAAIVGGIGANMRFPVDFLIKNTTIQNNLMSAAFQYKVKKFIFLGSSCIYPKECPQPIREEYLLSGKLEPSNSAYAIAKIAGIELIKSYRSQYDLEWISLMPTNLYGPRDNFNLESSHVLPALIRKFINAEQNGVKEITLWGSGNARREFLHTDDLARAVALAHNSYNDSSPLNIGTGVDLTIKELASLIARLTGFNGKIKWNTSIPDGALRKVLDVTKLKSLGWEPQVDLENGINKTIDWFKDAVKNGSARL